MRTAYYRLLLVVSLCMVFANGGVWANRRIAWKVW